jgi:hypothetical protein
LGLLSPHIPSSFSGIRKERKFLLNFSMINAQGPRVMIIAMEVLKKKEEEKRKTG